MWSKGDNMLEVREANACVVLRAVELAGKKGASKAELATATGMHECTVLRHINGFLKQRVIERNFESGPNIRYGMPGFRRAYRAAASVSAKAHYARDHRRRRYEKEAEKFCAKPFVHRIVPASSVQIVKPGPASVWELAA